MIKVALSALVAAAAIGLLFLWGGIDPRAVWDAARSISPWTFAVGLAIQASIYVFRAIRLRGLLVASGDEALPDTAQLTAACSAWILDSQVLPAKVGEATLVFHLARVGVKPEHGVVGLLLSRLLDLATLVTVLGLTCIALGLSGQRPALAWLPVLGAALFAGAIVLLLGILRGGSAVALVRRLLVRLGLERTSRGRRVSAFAAKVEAALRSVPKGALMRAAFWSVPVWASVLGVYAVLGQGVGLTGVGVFDLLFGSSLAILGSVVPINGFLGFGMQDVGWVAGFSAVGVEKSQAAATGLAFHALYLLGVGLLGTIGHLVLSHRRRP